MKNRKSIIIALLVGAFALGSVGTSIFLFMENRELNNMIKSKYAEDKTDGNQNMTEIMNSADENTQIKNDNFNEEKVESDEKNIDEVYKQEEADKFIDYIKWEEDEEEEKEDKEETIITKIQEKIAYKDLVSNERIKNIRYPTNFNKKSIQIDKIVNDNYLSEKIDGSMNPLNTSSLIITKNIKGSFTVDKIINIRNIKLSGLNESYINGCFESSKISNNLTVNLKIGTENIRNKLTGVGYTDLESFSTGSCPGVSVYNFAHKSYLKDKIISFSENKIDRNKNIEIEINYPLSISFNKYQSQGINKAGIEFNDKNIKIEIEYIEFPEDIKISNHKIVNNGTNMEIHIESLDDNNIVELIDIKPAIKEIIKIGEMRNLTNPYYSSLLYKITDYETNVVFDDIKEIYFINVVWIKIDWEMTLSN